MKGTSFQNGVEFKITIDGESWNQGDTLRGRIESKPVSDAQIFLVDALERKIKAKAADAFIVLGEKTPEKTPYEWSFPLTTDARITDKPGSLYLLYGKGDAMEKFGLLKLNILPHTHLRDLTDLMTTHFRFALKGISSHKKGFTEIKLDPPGVKEWNMLEQLVILAKLHDESLECQFIFHRKEVDSLKGGLQTKVVKREMKRDWARHAITHDFNQRLNKEVLTAEIEKIILEYREAGWLSSS